MVTLSARGSTLRDARWEQLFQAVYGAAIPDERRPTAGRDKDFADLVVLVRHLGITDPGELVAIAHDVYGEDAVELSDGRDSYLRYAERVIDEASRSG